MEIWWIAPMYVVLFFVAKRRGMKLGWLFALMEGVFLAQYTFFYLPQIFIWNLIQATVWVLLGILLGSALETRFFKEKTHILSPILFFCCAVIFTSNSIGFVHGVLGGVGLYLAAGAVLPDVGYKKENITTSFGGIVGFLLGTVLLFYI